MASPSRAVSSKIDPNNTVQQISDQRGEVNSVVWESILRQWPSIEEYVQSQLGPSVSVSDFSDRIISRLADRVDETTNIAIIDELVQKTVRFLAHEERRTAYRRAKFYAPDANLDNLKDPASLDFVHGLDSETKARAILERVPPEMVPIIDSLFGFQKETVTQKALAKSLGISRQTLKRRLNKLFEDLRTTFGKC